MEISSVTCIVSRVSLCLHIFLTPLTVHHSGRSLVHCCSPRFWSKDIQAPPALLSSRCIQTVPPGRLAEQPRSESPSTQHGQSHHQKPCGLQTEWKLHIWKESGGAAESPDETRGSGKSEELCLNPSQPHQQMIFQLNFCAVFHHFSLPW